MSDATRLATRKQVLLARSSLQRLELAQGLGELRESLRWGRSARSLVASTPARTALLGIAIATLGRGRVVLWVRGALLAFAAVQLGAALLRWRAASSDEAREIATARSPLTD